MFRHTAVQVHKKMVRKEDQTMSIVPRPSGLDTHPVVEGTMTEQSIKLVFGLSHASKTVVDKTIHIDSDLIWGE